MVLSKINSVTIKLVSILFLGMLTSCELEYSPADSDCADCLSFEPLEAELYMEVTINNKYREVPVVVLNGTLGSRDTVAVDTITNQMGYINVPLSGYYTVIAEYQTGTKTVKAVDGDDITKYDISNKCGETCWIIRGGIINVKLKYDD